MLRVLIRHNIHFQYKEEKSALIILILPLWDFSKGLKDEFETAVVDEPSVFEPLKFYCTCHTLFLWLIQRLVPFPNNPHLITEEILWFYLPCTVR